MKERIARLLTVKSIITLVLTGVFSFLAITNVITSSDFMTIFTVVIAFYFGTQTTKTTKDTKESGETKND